MLVYVCYCITIYSIYTVYIYMYIYAYHLNVVTLCTVDTARDDLAFLTH